MNVIPANQNHIAEILEIYRPYIEKTAISFEALCPALDEFTKRFMEIAKNCPWLVLIEEGRVKGYAYALEFNPRCAYRFFIETSVYVDIENHTRGIGSSLYRHLLDQLKMAGYYNAIAGITLPNEKSVHLHQKFGFKPVGIYKKVGFKMGKWHDVGYWQLSLQEKYSNPKALNFVW